jgi:hypothetical protein
MLPEKVAAKGAAASKGPRRGGMTIAPIITPYVSADDRVCMSGRAENYLISGRVPQDGHQRTSHPSCAAVDDRSSTRSVHATSAATVDLRAVISKN